VLFRWGSSPIALRAARLPHGPRHDLPWVASLTPPHFGFWRLLDTRWIKAFPSWLIPVFLFPRNVVSNKIPENLLPRPQMRVVMPSPFFPRTVFNISSPTQLSNHSNQFNLLDISFWPRLSPYKVDWAIGLWSSPDGSLFFTKYVL